jgi:hypothetical protein
MPISLIYSLIQTLSFMGCLNVLSMLKAERRLVQVRLGYDKETRRVLGLVLNGSKMWLLTMKQPTVWRMNNGATAGIRTRALCVAGRNHTPRQRSHAQPLHDTPDIILTTMNHRQPIRPIRAGPNTGKDRLNPRKRCPTEVMVRIVPNHEQSY